MKSYHRIECGTVSASWKSKPYHKCKVLIEVLESPVQVEACVKTMKGSHMLILECKHMQASLKLCDSKFTPKPAIKKLMHKYSSECMEHLDKIKRGISLYNTAGRYSTAMEKNKEKYPYLTRQHAQSPETEDLKAEVHQEENHTWTPNHLVLKHQDQLTVPKTEQTGSHNQRRLKRSHAGNTFIMQRSGLIHWRMVNPNKQSSQTHLLHLLVLRKYKLK